MVRSLGDADWPAPWMIFSSPNRMNEIKNSADFFCLVWTRERISRDDLNFWQGDFAGWLEDIFSNFFSQAFFLKITPY